MVALLYIFPILFILFAIGAFFVDLNEPKGKIIFMGMAFVLLILLIGNEVAVHMQVSQTSSLKNQVDQNETWKTGQIARMNTILASMSAETQNEKEKLASFATLGWSSNNPVLLEAQAADAARAELLSFMPEAQNKVIIENLPMAVDRMLVSFALEEMGFIVSALQAQYKYTESSETNDDTESDEEGENDPMSDDDLDTEQDTDQTSQHNKIKPEVNFLEFGYLVRNNDIKLVLYTLLRAGIPLKHARVFRDKNKENARNIKFSYSKSYEKRSAYSVDRIKKTKEFKR